MSLYDTFNKTQSQSEFSVLCTITGYHRLLLFIIVFDGAQESTAFSSLGLNTIV